MHSGLASSFDVVGSHYGTHDDPDRLKLKNVAACEKFIAIIGRDPVGKLKNKNQRLVETITKLDFIA